MEMKALNDEGGFVNGAQKQSYTPCFSLQSPCVDFASSLVHSGAQVQFGLDVQQHLIITGFMTEIIVMLQELFL